jgi:hypothetical protein
VLAIAGTGVVAALATRHGAVPVDSASRVPGGTPAGGNGGSGSPPASSGSASSAGTGGQGTGGPGTAVPATVATVASTGGTEAAWVVAENQRPGTTAWRIDGTPPGNIAGFADHTSAHAGDSVTLYVTTDAGSFRVEAYRMGWYGGAGGRLVWTSAQVGGVEQPPCTTEAVTNMVSCADWAPSSTFAVGAAFVPGDYLLKLVGAGGQESYVPLTVTDPGSHAAFAVENDIYTWQAWNPYGGFDFYQGSGHCPAAVYPVCNRARVVSFDRPYGYNQGAADFFGNEYPLVRFMEQQGLDVTYLTSADIEQDPALLLHHRAFLSLGHDECWSYAERLAAQAAEAHGVNILFFGASPMLRHVRLEASTIGALRQEVDYRDSAEDPLDGTGPARQVTGNTWSDPPASWSEVPFVGASYTGYVRAGEPAVPYLVADGSSWLFAGTGLQTGSEIPGLLISDFDQVDPGLSPANVQVLGHSPMPLDEVQTNVTDPASDTTYWTDPASQAGVFDTGTVAWIPDLASSPVVGRMTANLLDLFGAGPAGGTQPSVPNWRSIYY